MVKSLQLRIQNGSDRSFQSGQMSQRQVTRKYGVHRTTIVAWEKKYGNPEKKLPEDGRKNTTTGAC